VTDVLKMNGVEVVSVLTCGLMIVVVMIEP